MKTVIPILVLFITACTDLAEPTATVDQDIEFAYCTDGFGRIECWPDGISQGQDYCAANCAALGSETGYCPQYSDAERRYCTSHCFADHVNCNDLCLPAQEHQCIAGWPP